MIIRLMMFTILMAFISMPALAEKLEWAGKGNPGAEQREAHQAAMKEKVDDAEEAVKDQAKKEKREKSKEMKAKKAQLEQEANENLEKAKGLEKQQAKKMEQTHNELGKGSEQGQAAREESSRKWWKFWGEE